MSKFIKIVDTNGVTVLVNVEQVKYITSYNNSNSIVFGMRPDGTLVCVNTNTPIPTIMSLIEK